MKHFFILLAVTLASAQSFAGNHIKVYFNKPVDTTVATFEKAAYLNTCIADTLVAYINRAHHSLDICMYDFESTFSYDISTVDTVFAPAIAAAIDSAYARGVKIRYIYEASNANTGLSLLDTNIYTLGSPQGSAYNIMHNKFVVIDAASPNKAEPTVWTGCLNWYYEQFNWDYNNVVVIQDSALAHAYTAEFNMMWGDTGIAPDTITSKFGQFKTDLGLHNFTIDGHQVELYFSPSDGTDNHIQSSIETANKDLYFGMYTFTEHTDANDIMHKFDSGLYVYGIDDSYSLGYYPASTFSAGMGTHYKIYTESTDTLFHNKYLIVDPSDTCSDPLVLTGSHNWTTSANTLNDENTLIIHSDTVANDFLQYFSATFKMLGGTLTLPANNCIPLGVVEYTPTGNGLRIYPNPTTGFVGINYHIANETNVQIAIFDITGRMIAQPVKETIIYAGAYHDEYTILVPGVYLIQMTTDQEVISKRVSVF